MVIAPPSSSLMSSYIGGHPTCISEERRAVGRWPTVGGRPDTSSWDTQRPSASSAVEMQITWVHPEDHQRNPDVCEANGSNIPGRSVKFSKDFGPHSCWVLFDSAIRIHTYVYIYTVYITTYAHLVLCIWGHQIPSFQFISYVYFRSGPFGLGYRQWTWTHKHSRMGPKNSMELAETIS